MLSSKYRNGRGEWTGINLDDTKLSNQSLRACRREREREGIVVTRRQGPPEAPLQIGGKVSFSGVRRGYYTTGVCVCVRRVGHCLYTGGDPD